MKMALKAKDIAKMTKEDALKSLTEVSKSLLELEPTSQKKKSVKKTIARLKTYIHGLESKPGKAQKEAPASGQGKAVKPAPKKQ